MAYFKVYIEIDTDDYFILKTDPDGERSKEIMHNIQNNIIHGYIKEIVNDDERADNG